MERTTSETFDKITVALRDVLVEVESARDEWDTRGAVAALAIASNKVMSARWDIDRVAADAARALERAKAVSS